MMEDYEDKILEDHDYDGIHEYDNPMPGWWTGAYLLSVIWSVAYVAGHLTGYMPTYETDLHDGQLALESQRAIAAALNPPVVIDETALSAAFADDSKSMEGALTFASFCASCHGEQGQGLIGPNLTDKFWIYGDAPMNLVHIIQKGNNNGMPAWEATITPEQTIALVAHLRKIQGTTPPNPKAPQGELYEPDAALKER
jgi:cytochrome c oxidase cbb3-type subunit 3